MNEQQLKSIVESVLAEMQAPNQTPKQPIPLHGGVAEGRGGVPIEASARHVHLSAEAFTALFGPGELTQTRALSQPGEFLAGQRVGVITPKGMIENVAVLGPLRPATQVELSLTDCRKLGLKAPVRLSGNLAGAADCVLVGPAGIYEARGSVIVAQNHIHMTPADASAYGLHDGAFVAVCAETARPVIFEQVAVRVSEKFALAMHIDFDEANACALVDGSVGMLNAKCLMLNEAPASVCEDKVITEARAKELSRTGRVTLRRGTIVTPSAKDIFNAAKCEVEYT